MDILTKIGADLAVALTTLVTKSTAAAVFAKTKNLKEQKDIDKLRASYDELINEILQERDEAIRIAQCYKDELEKIVISEDDLKHLHNTVTHALNIMSPFMGGTALDEKNAETLKNIINIDVLKTMQLLGFNYKAAIGQPLTEVCAKKISSWGENKTSTLSNQKRK